MILAACFYSIFTFFVGVIVGDMHAKPTKNK
jgi:hypothetical protein